MDDTTQEITLVVPQSALRRSELQAACRSLVKQSGIKPPVGYTKLYDLAQMAITKAQGPSEELAFALLLCGNELWRPYIEATPFHRRLLLLPQCLRDSKLCKGNFDDLGLACAGCNSCPMNTVLEEAETLGYTTLIAEGTTVAVELVEEGSIDAVIGVSCMATLQKSFIRLFSTAIPGIAIPLLYDGCCDTEVDTNWLLSEIKTQQNISSLKPLSVSLLKQEVEELFTEANLKTILFGKEQLTTTEKLAAESLLQHGRHIRPLLTLLAFNAYCNNQANNLSHQLMVSMECFHKASLIHDDIEDNDDFRYHQKTVHAEHGIPIAVNLGDLLIGKGYQLLAELPLAADRKAVLFEMVSKLHVQSTIGQGEELLMNNSQAPFGTQRTLKQFEQKTGSAIQVALLLGAIAAGAPVEETQQLGRFASLFGIAYQIRDDLTEFQGTATDQHTASFPILKSLLVENGHPAPNNEDEWIEAVRKQNIEEEAVVILNNHLSEMNRVLYELNSHKLRLALLNITHSFFKQEFYEF